jgi:hypothetical protein
VDEICVGIRLLFVIRASSLLSGRRDMLFIMRVLESLGLLVEKPMILKVNNQGAVDLANNWSIEGRTRHIEVCQYF